MYNEALNVIWRAHSFEASAALSTLERYTNGTIIQWSRIQADKEALLRPNPSPYQIHMLTLFLDIHFYFICVDKVQNLLKFFIITDGDPELNEILKTLKPKFKPFRDARNHLEHIEGDIKKEYLSDFGNLENDTFTFGGERFDISASGLQILTDAYEQVIAILRLRPSSDPPSPPPPVSALPAISPPTPRPSHSTLHRPPPREPDHRPATQAP